MPDQKPDVLLATSAAMPGLHTDDRHLLRELLDRGVSVQPAVWEDPHAPWNSSGLVVVRSAWDYAYRRDDFVAWAERVAARRPLWNPPSIVRWNTHKRYLLDLEAAGAPVTPTALLERGTRVDLVDLVDGRGWRSIVIKAAVGQSGRYAMKVDRDRIDAGQGHLDRLLPHEDMLVQKFLEPVTESGEISLVYIDRELTHAVRKRGAGGDFRVHDDYGGEVDLERPTPAERDAAETALAAVEDPWMYARVDLVDDRGGGPRVMELELVEPELFLRFSDAALRRFADAIERELGRQGLR